MASIEERVEELFKQKLDSLGVTRWSKTEAPNPEIRQALDDYESKTDAAGRPVIDPARTWHPDGFVPDWDYMAAYIRAIEKLVIKDVVDFKDEVISKTRAVVAAREHS